LNGIIKKWAAQGISAKHAMPHAIVCMLAIQKISPKKPLAQAILSIYKKSPVSLYKSRETEHTISAI
jgi:hypothetical protein